MYLAILIEFEFVKLIQYIFYCTGMRQISTIEVYMQSLLCLMLPTNFLSKTYQHGEVRLQNCALRVLCFLLELKLT